MKRILILGLVSLTLAGPSFAAKRPACQKVPDGKGGTVWARPVKGGWSTLSCELSITLHLTDRVQAPDVKRATATTCTVWVPPHVGNGKVVVDAYSACVDSMHAAAEKGVE